MITDYHAKFFAHELSRVGGNGVDRIGRALFDACVDLNPHQIEAALFALRSPLSKGALLADEVGLGKTIEAGLVLCQSWAERHRSILVITPASLRKQWALELSEKFNLPSIVLDAKTYGEQKADGIPNPFRDNRIVICSMHYAASRAAEVKAVDWDLIVMDEAHRLRNCYRQSNQIGQRILHATEGRKKLLLSATPLQNSLLELYGLSSLIDTQMFGDLTSFRAQYTSDGGDLSGLRDRLKYFCWRTLRSDVAEFIRYTERKLITRPFQPTQREFELYEAVSAYLQREDAYALPKRQRHLLVLLIRKVLASSPNAVAGTLEKLRTRLIELRGEFVKNASVTELVIAGEDLDDEVIDEILEDEEDNSASGDAENSAGTANPIDLRKLDAEIEELSHYINWARSIGVDTKTRSLLKALEIGFEKMVEQGAARKAVIFTESRRTQAWLKDFLEGNGYTGQVVTFNGSNKDDATGAIYEQWLAENQANGKASSSKQVDLREAIIDNFRNKATIMIATEAGAEGINLQFCSLLVNFDLPWNPQRIEQRIGRCHRYGQKKDVVVINFLNERNAADRRVYELLEEKFKLFSGVFGTSDEVLGTIESGVDFEHRILDIYQQCRTEEEIQAAFEQLRKELDEQIQARMQQTRTILMEHFDEYVHDRLKVNLTNTQEKLDAISRMFWALSKHMLADQATFNDNALTFDLQSSPLPEVNTGRYNLISKMQENEPNEFLYRLSHPLGEHVIAQGKQATCPIAEVEFDITNHGTHIAVVENLKGKSGWLSLQHLRVDSFDTEEYLLFSAIDEDGNSIDHETCTKLFNCEGTVAQSSQLPHNIGTRLAAEDNRYAQATIARNLEENNKHFQEARDQLDKWAEDMELAAQRELDDIKAEIKDLQRRSRQAVTLEEQHDIQRQITDLEGKKRQKRHAIFDLDDEIEGKRNRLVEVLERRMMQKTATNNLFQIRWKVI